MTDYFSVFDLPATFDLDLAALEKRYFEAQRKSHPDRLTGKSAQERQQAILQSMQVNEAYEALRLPLSRARHLLALQGIAVGGERDSVKPSQALLMEIMALREALSEAGSAEEASALAEQNAKDKTATVAGLSAAFARKDFPAAAELTIRLGYLEKIADETKIKVKGLSSAS